jgi:RHS repeat-associated protein
VQDSSGNIIAQYQYDGTGRLVEELSDFSGSTPGTVTYSFYDGQNAIETRTGTVSSGVVPTASSLSPQYQYVFSPMGGKTPILRDDFTTGTAYPRLYYTSDANTNVTALVNASGQVVERYVYSAYGVVTFCDASWAPLTAGGTNTTTTPGVSSAVGNTTLYASMVLDPRTGLFYDEHRWYDAWTSTFVSQDPALADSNLYRYCTDNPVIFVDPTGLWNADVHNGRTVQWAESLHMPNSGASLIGQMDDRVDTDFNPTTINDANWSWHFDRSHGGRDSRLVHADQEFLAAERLVDWSRGQDDWQQAALHMGRALHPLQDWVAHGDFDRWREAPSLVVGWNETRLHYWHNWDHPGLNPGFGNQPDDPTLDANGPNGRATFGVLILGHTYNSGDRTYWTNFHPGTQRIRLTERLTRSWLTSFMVYVCAHSKPHGASQRAFIPLVFRPVLPDKPIDPIV